MVKEAELMRKRVWLNAGGLPAIKDLWHDCVLGPIMAKNTKRNGYKHISDVKTNGCKYN